jgi:hypothetical protein
MARVTKARKRNLDEDTQRYQLPRKIKSRIKNLDTKKKLENFLREISSI